MQRWQQSAYRMGCDALLTIVIDEALKPDAIFEKLWHYIDEFDSRFSRFNPKSELIALNNNAGQWVSVSSNLYDFLTVSNGFQDYTKGLYTPFILPALQYAGYAGSWPKPEIVSSDIDFRSRLASQAFKVQLRKPEVKLPPSTAIDSGGIGKGYALEKLADLAQELGVTNYWFSLGGDIICRGHDTDAKPWRIEIQPQLAGKKPKNIRLNSKKRQAIATSGTYKRKGTSWHHIIDPRTMLPADTTVVQATVVADSAVAADCYATCLIIDPDFVPQHNGPKIIQQILEKSVTLNEQPKGEKNHV